MNLVEQRILQKNLAKFLIEDVFNTISDEDILRIVTEKDARGAVVKVKWLHKGVELNEDKVRALRGQAQAFIKTSLWKILREEIIWHAQKKTLDKGETEADLVSAKLLRYFVDVLESKLKSMSE
jgi:hypothetical protein